MKTFTTQSGVPCILLNHGKRVILAPRIKYIEGDGNYSNIKVEGGESLISSFTLRLFSDGLSTNTNFFSPRKGLLLNLNFLEEIQLKSGTLYARLRTGEVLPLSRRKGKSLIEYISDNKLKIQIREVA
ncbi:LytTR family transcriptional regulator DNA-binding domain-containing protein [Arcticibacterium luteifluviistationis]|nr:LytTR family transcriptional regulator DNA-binding domain-containing protein [Arcticibacterium luteifluviistationis]